MATRTCKRCFKDMPITSFALIAKSKKSNDPERRYHICRRCRTTQRLNAGRCQCGQPLHGKRKCLRCMEIDRVYSIKRRRADKQLVIEHYGGKCVFCGDNRTFFLQIDHVNDDGAEHRREIGHGYHIYPWLIKNNFPTGFQLACCNCNFGKMMYGEAELLRLLADSNLASSSIPINRATSD